MSQTNLLERVISHWTDVLNDPSIREMCDDYEALKGEPDEYDEDAQHPVDGVLEGLTSIDTSAESLSAEAAQSLHFLQKFAKTEIKAVQKTTLPFRSTQAQREMIDVLKTRLADIESLTPPEEMKRLSKEARNQQRIDDGEIESLNGYKNWLHGTLTEEQQDILTALEWQTAAGPLHPGKAVVRFADEFANDLVFSHARAVSDTKRPFINDPEEEGRWKNAGMLLVNTVITKLAVDSIVFMTSVTGTHQIVKDRAAEASDIMKQEGNVEAAKDLLDDFLGDDSLIVENAANYDSSQTISVDALAIEEARCLDKVDSPWNLIDQGLEAVSPLDITLDVGLFDIPLKCEAAREGLQNWFAVATATPRTLQDGQKALSEFIMKEGSVAAEAYNRHHETATNMIENIAYADNALHVVLLGLGTVHAFKIYGEHGLDSHKALWRGLKQQAHLAKKRSWTLTGAGAGWAYYAATHGEMLSLEMAPYMVVGAVAGFFTQKARIGYKDNQKFIFNLHADAPKLPANATIPVTSADQKSKRPLTAMFMTYAAAGATFIIASNTGVVHDASPEILKASTNGYMLSAAIGGALTSWGIFDRLDDVAYHKLFYGTPLSVPFSVSAAADVGQQIYKKTLGAPPIQRAWKKVSRYGKETLAAALFVTNTVFDPGSDNPNSVYIRNEPAAQTTLIIEEEPLPSGV